MTARPGAHEFSPTARLTIPRLQIAYDADMSTDIPGKPFAMIREFHPADWFTLGNAICGTAAHVLHPLVLVFGLSGSLMISRFHIPKL
jgi:hypothetical protein